MTKSMWAKGVSLVAAAAMLVGGCSKSREQRVFARKGVVKSVNLSTRTACIVIEDKLGQGREVDGRFTDGTTLTINGKPALLGDIHAGDAAEVSGYRKGKGFDAELIATKVAVSRAVTSRPSS